MQTVILGLGNELLGDEGVGVHAARLLQLEELPDNTQVIEVGTAILDALSVFENADRIIVIDAMKDSMPPGTIYKTTIDQCGGSQCIASMHGFDIFRTMSLAGRRESPEVVVFGIEPEEITWSMELSPGIAESLTPLIDAVKKEIFGCL